MICTRQAVKSMKTRDVNGQIININSIFGHKVNQAVPGNKPMNSLYPPVKHAITAFTECLRQELLYLQTQIKISVSEN
jgi:NADP+-dependent farnesol dehydrogenase